MGSSKRKSCMVCTVFSNCKAQNIPNSHRTNRKIWQQTFRSSDVQRIRKWRQQPVETSVYRDFVILSYKGVPITMHAGLNYASTLYQIKLKNDPSNSGNIYGPFYRIGAKCGPTTRKTIYKTIKYSDIDIY